MSENLASNFKKSYAVIMAGGSGTRFWPWSRKKRPKQFLPIMGENSLIQDTVNRLEGLIPAERILVVTDDNYEELVREHLPKLPSENIICEPVGRNTGPCIALAAAHILSRDPEGIMVAMAADHYIVNVEKYRKLLAFASDYALKNDKLVTLGIPPAYPETGYGYYRRGKMQASQDDIELFDVLEIVEKPDLETCISFLQSGEYFWHGMQSTWKASVILEQFRQHLPEVYKLTMQVYETINKPTYQATLDLAYKLFPNISIDVGIMEKAVKDTVIMPARVDWSDVGSWLALANLRKSAKFSSENDKSLAIDSSDCLVISDGGKLVVTLGVKNLVIVETSDAILVADQNNSQKVRDVIEKLKVSGMEKFI